MSTRRIDYNGVTFEITAGTTKSFEITIEDPFTGEIKPLTDTTVYDSFRFKIIKPDKTVIATITGSYLDRPNGLVGWTVDDDIATNDNAGNWIGELEFLNNLSEVVDQQMINFNILESY